MDYGEIDRWIGRLGTSESAFEKLESFGEPALQRLFDVLDGAVSLPFSGEPRESFTDRSRALGRLGARYPESLMGLINGRTNLKLGVIQALGFTGHERFKAIAKEALKTFGND
jgi:hypothetical protein